MAQPPHLFTLESRSLKLDTAADLTPHLTPLTSSPPNTITEIRLNGNTLGVPAAQSLAQNLSPQASSLTSANLADIFTSRLLEEIPPALSSLLDALLQSPNLQRVDLSDNAFGLNTKEPLVKFLERWIPGRELVLNNNGMGPIAGSAIADALAKSAERKTENKNVPDLEMVICGRNRLENGSMAAWAKAYERHSGVKVVKMTQNGIRQEGVSHLLREGLSHAKGLEVLDLQDNTFTIKGATALAEALPSWPDLKELGIGDCLTGARGFIRVAEALGKGKNKNVEVLRLQFNDIDSKGVKALLGAVKAGALPRLRRVELNGNKFQEDDSSVEALREILDERKEEAGNDDDDPEDHWGLDELDELEDEDSEAEEEDDEDEEGEEDEDDKKLTVDEEDDLKDKVLHEADQAESENVSQKKDSDVDALADTLKKTEI